MLRYILKVHTMPVVATEQKKQTIDPAAWSRIKAEKAEKAGIHSKVIELYDKTRSEKREMSSEEKPSLDKMLADMKAIDERIAVLENIVIDVPDEDMETDPEGSDTDTETETETEEDKERSMHNARNGNRPNNRPNRPTQLPDDKTRQADLFKPAKIKRIFGESDVDFKHRQRRSTRAYGNLCRDYMLYGSAAFMQDTNKRALQMDIDTKGGFLVLPEQINTKLLKAVDDIMWMSKFVTNTKLTNAQSLGTPTLDSNPDDADWTTEIASIALDDAMTFGKRVLMPTPVRKRLLVSDRWIRLAFNAWFDSADDANGEGGSPADIVINRLAYKIAITKEKAWHTGNGVGRPLGMYTASSRGINTDRDKKIATTNALTYQGLLNAKWMLKVQYQKTAQWEFSRDMMNKTMGLVDDNGRPLLDISTLPNVPDKLLQHPIQLSEFVPNSFADESYVGMLGDFRFYHTADSLEATIAQARELYMETAQVGFFVAAENDGMPALSEAFVRLQWDT